MKVIIYLKENLTDPKPLDGRVTFLNLVMEYYCYKC